MDLESYYWKARKVLATEERANEAFVRLVGVGGTAAGDFLGERSGIGRSAALLVEKVAVPGSSDPGELDKAGAALRLKERFVETSQIMAQAQGWSTSPAPLFPGGLVPSLNGRRWAAVPGA